MTTPSEVHDEHRRRLANQRLFRRYYVNCSCENGCNIRAYTGLVTKGHARHLKRELAGGSLRSALRSS